MRRFLYKVLMCCCKHKRFAVFVVVVFAHAKYKVKGVQHQKDKNHNNKKESDVSFL